MNGGHKWYDPASYTCEHCLQWNDDENGRLPIRKKQKKTYQ